jgi:hypothetical protein
MTSSRLEKGSFFDRIGQVALVLLVGTAVGSIIWVLVIYFLSSSSL